MSASYLDTYNTCDNNVCRTRLFGNGPTISWDEARQDPHLRVKGALVAPRIELCQSCYAAHQKRMEARSCRR
jgi:hypothetical protein